MIDFDQDDYVRCKYREYLNTFWCLIIKQYAANLTAKRFVLLVEKNACK